MRSVALTTLVLAAGWTAAAGQAPPKPTSGAASDASPTISERTLGLERREGFLPFYWDARRGQLLLEVPRTARSSSTARASPAARGCSRSGSTAARSALGVCRFERVGPRVLLIQRQMTHRSGVADAERARVVEESFPSSVLASLPIVAEEGDRVLVDATAFLLADTDVLPALRAAGVGRLEAGRRAVGAFTSTAPARFRATPRSRRC